MKSSLIFVCLLLCSSFSQFQLQKERGRRFALLPHAPMFLLPMVYNWSPHEDIYEGVKNPESDAGKGKLYKNRELEFQFSFAIPLIKDIGKRDWSVMAAYTHHAYWQVYNSKWSRPFRETNYTPELFTRYIYSTPKNILGIKIHSLDGGYAHQSNGQIQILSRGWDRLFGRAVLEAWSVRAQVSAWSRFDVEDDDNPDIEDYLGHGQMELIKEIEKHTLHVKMPLFARYPSYDLKYSYPISEGIRWLISFQSGYGHSLIEYNRHTQRVGVGFLLEDILY